MPYKNKEDRNAAARRYYNKKKDNKDFIVHRNAVKKEWRKANPLAEKLTLVKHLYGLSKEDYLSMSKCCEACGTTERLVIDHCHNTGDVRGTLCRKCNIALGHADDNIETLKALINYLGKTPHAKRAA